MGLTDASITFCRQSSRLFLTESCCLSTSHTLSGAKLVWLGWLICGPGNLGTVQAFSPHSVHHHQPLPSLRPSPKTPGAAHHPCIGSSYLEPIRCLDARQTITWVCAKGGLCASHLYKIRASAAHHLAFSFSTIQFACDKHRLSTRYPLASVNFWFFDCVSRPFHS